MSGIVGILLAAGCSRRFGSDKRVHSMPDGTLMVLASARRLAAACSRTIVVIRPDDSVLSGLLAAEGLETVVCTAAEKGLGHSLSSGVAASADADGWLIALADMPYIQRPSYDAVVGALQEGAHFARPVFSGQMGHPVGFSAEYFSALLALTGDQGGKAIIDADPGALMVCPVDDPGVLKDIDQPSQIRLANR